jgi:biopolymer transport protein ExbB
MGLFAGPSRTRLAALVFASLLFVFAYGVTVTDWWQPAARAQEAPDAAAAPAAPEHKNVNMFLHIIYSVGPVMGVVFLLLSVSLVALIVLLFLDLRMGDAVPAAFVEEFTDTVNKRRFKEAFEMTRQDSSFVARVLAVGMGRLQYGIEDAREAALNTVETIKAKKEQFITYLATIGSLGPLIGLIGTVYSMVGAFMEMANSDHTDQKKMAQTLSHGLVVTMLGIGLAVPAILFAAFFRNRLIGLANETSNVADDLLTQMYHNSKKPAPAGAAGDARPVATGVKAAD